jgi:serine phosphatase RsbU (regulator of sigma subunit)
VVFYTDGLVECGRDVMFGEAALAQAIARDDVRHAPDAAAAIRDAMVDCEKAEDDIAILVARLV